MPIYLTAASFSFGRPFSTLLRYDGTEYPGGTIVNSIRFPSERSTNEITVRADNSIAFSEMGKRIGWMDGFILDCFREDAVALIQSDIGRAETESVFILEMPAPRFSDNPGRRFYIRFWAAPFEPAMEIRSMQGMQYHRADMTDTPIEVLRGEDM